MDNIPDVKAPVYGEFSYDKTEYDGYISMVSNIFSTVDFMPIIQSCWKCSISYDEFIKKANKCLIAKFSPVVFSVRRYIRKWVDSHIGDIRDLCYFYGGLRIKKEANDIYMQLSFEDRNVFENLLLMIGNQEETNEKLKQMAFGAREFMRAIKEKFSPIE